MWRDFLESGEEWALVAEDDALIHASIDEIVSRVIEKSLSIGVVNFADGWSTQMGRMNARTPYPRLSLFSPFIWGRHRLGYCANDWTACTGLYLISRSAAQKIIEQIDARGSQYWLADDWPLFAADFGVDIRSCSQDCAVGQEIVLSRKTGRILCTIKQTRQKTAAPQ